MESAREAVKLVVNLFESLGFVILDERSVLEPYQLLEYIGFPLYLIFNVYL